MSKKLYREEGSFEYKTSQQSVPERQEKNKSLISQIGRSLDMMGGFKNLFPQGDKAARQMAEQKEVVKITVEK